ncbi:MAG TPA: DUF58 domain-containing protein [Gemmatimonadaceae bacterium]|nr:DUF58 domain-containing protein [Gemmatimonadaceae bacterium]
MLRSGGGEGPLVQYAGLLDALTGLTWPSASRARAGDPGAHRSTRLGRSPEFTEYRAYRPGDDLRRLDWKLYGRTDRPFLRIANDHAALRTAIVVDASASMRFPVDGYGKWEHACAIALGLTAIAIAEGDAAGVVVAGANGDRTIPPRRRRDVLIDLADMFAAVTPAGSASIADTLIRAAAQPRLVVISDFLGSAERAIPALRVAAASGSEIFAVHVAAEAELDPPARTFIADDPEEPGMQRPLSADNRDAYLAAFAEWRSTIASALHGMNASYVLTSTAEPVRDAVRRVVAGHAAMPGDTGS